MARVEMKPEMFDELIESLGHKAKWYRSCVCSCVNRHSGQPDFTCKICKGEGYRYLAPQEIIVGVTMLGGNYQFKEQGLEEFGNAYVTPKKGVILGYHDKLEFIDFKCLYSEPLHISYDEDGYGISSVTKRKILSVVFCADNMYEYEEQYDIEITDDRHHIKFLNKETADIVADRDISILYYTTPVYLIEDLLHELRGTRITVNSPNGEPYYTELPKQYRIHRIDFDYGIKQYDNQELEPHTPKHQEPSEDSLVDDFINTPTVELPQNTVVPLEEVEDCPSLPADVKERVANLKRQPKLLSYGDYDEI